MNQIKLVVICITITALAACTTSQGVDAAKALSSLFGGPPDRAQMLDPTVEEALQYEFDKCMSGKEFSADSQSQCIQLAYATVKEDMNLEERPGQDGTVIIERVDDEGMIYEDTSEQDEDNQENIN